MERRRARECALKILYQKEMREEPVEVLLKEFWESSTVRSQGVKSYAEKIVHGVMENFSEIDRLISGAALNWQLERMGMVDRNILRIGVWELLFSPDVPKAVVINEAIEIARLYSGDESPGFVNGILDKVARVQEEKSLQQRG